tara:strand:+ start:859 stop:969 length:111 start_codon:yes stop_codon:yes gene_type:complete
MFGGWLLRRQHLLPELDDPVSEVMKLVAAYFARLIL